MLVVTLVMCDEHDHVYSDRDEVVLWMNTVGPYHNRQETYGYFTLPFCVGPKESISHYHETISEALQGTELEFSGLQIDFKADIHKSEYCKVKLDDDNLKAFLYAGKNTIVMQGNRSNLSLNFEFQSKTIIGIKCTWMTSLFGE